MRRTEQRAAANRALDRVRPWLAGVARRAGAVAREPLADSRLSQSTTTCWRRWRQAHGRQPLLFIHGDTHTYRVDFRDGQGARIGNALCPRPTAARWWVGERRPNEVQLFRF